MEDFGWRISIADLDTAGPFSRFPVVERHIVILAGTLCLRFDDGDRVIAAGDTPFSFSGSSPVEGDPVGGPVRDLNLMVRSDHFNGHLRIVDPEYCQGVSPFTVVIAPRAATVMVDTEILELDAEDALLLYRPAVLKSSSQLILAEIWTLS